MAQPPIVDYYPLRTQLSPDLAKDQVIHNLSIWLAASLKELLETKHLYQKVSTDPAALLAQTTQRLGPLLGERQQFELWARSQILSVPAILMREERPWTTNSAILPIPLLLLNVKLCCQRCDRREAFSPVWHSTFPNDGTMFRGSTQIFLIGYQCQSCQGTAESLLVRRSGWELQLHGRSPIEQVEIPRFMPKTEYNLFRDSVIAFNSGKTLAALFYLRSFIEQFARRLTGKTGKVAGDEVMKA
jgi:hypothetical protein